MLKQNISLMFDIIDDDGERVATVKDTEFNFS